jgi:predicted RNase H-like HicB family nuclease
MAAHHVILEAAQRLCADRKDPVFTADEVVRALPHLNPQTVRTHVTSRCCVNARPHHQSRLEYFRKRSRGQYELLPQHRRTAISSPGARHLPARTPGPQRDTIHAVITKDGDTYVADCHEVAVVTQGRTVDETLRNLLTAVALHLEGEDLRTIGLGRLRRIHVSYEMPADASAA